MNPRCGDCGHQMYHLGRGWKCIENTCPIGLFNLGDHESAKAKASINPPRQ